MASMLFQADRACVSTKSVASRWGHHGDSVMNSPECLVPARYCAVQPPSITSSLPVTKEDSSEAR